MNGYTTLPGQDQDNQTISKYTNNQSQCKSDCDSNGTCIGMVTNGSNCWTINGFPSQYSKSGSTTYRKNPPTSNFNGYSMLTGQDQNGKSLAQYKNNTQSSCYEACNSNSNCAGMVLNGNNCWTISSFPSQYSNPGSAIYKKTAPAPTATAAPAPAPPPPPPSPPTFNFDGYSTILGQDQNGLTIGSYTNNTQLQCNTDCNSNPKCQGITINGSNCSTISSFPSPYSNPSSGTYKKQAPTVNFDGYTATPGQDQNGQPISQYTNNQSQCKLDCDSNSSCQGMVINGSNCFTINSLQNPYSNPGSTTYKKNPPTSNFNQYNKIIGQDQNGNTLSQYTNNQSTCNSDCNSNPYCKGMTINGSNCSTVTGFTNTYNNPGSAIYEKVYPIPAVTSNNFPTSANNNLYSSVFCKNISTNNGFIQKSNSTFNNLPVYNTQTTPDENTCLNNCNADKYCSSYSFQNNNSSSNCLLYNQVPTSISNNNNINSGYKSNYNYDFNNLNSSQKNVIRNDCINNYLNNNYNTNNIDYSSYYSLGNNNSELNFNAESLAIVYEPLGKVNIINNFTNNDTDSINAITNQELNDFTNNYTGYQQSQLGILNSSNETNSSNSYYTQEINNNTNIQSENATNNLLQEKNINTNLINQRINGNENNNITESFENNIVSNNIDKSNTINFYLFIFIVIIFLYILYYLKKNKYFK